MSLVAILWLAIWTSAQADGLQPGNVFLEGDDIRVEAPKGTHWRALNELGELLAAGEVAPEGDRHVANLSHMPIGWYRIEFIAADGTICGSTAAAVLSRPVQDAGVDSPVAVDGALSWLANSDENRPLAIKLASLTQVGWIRDRLHWREIQSEPKLFAGETRYDVAARLQSATGMRVLQVFHTQPRWVVDAALDGRRPDLRLVYEFTRHLSKRFDGTVAAWEPWNEANAPNFGGWTINELCSYQKAAYLGFKAGNPEALVSWAPLGGINTRDLVDGILANETWPYYDTYNIHSYDWPHAFENLWAPARDAASGKPLWVTEADRGLEATSGSEPGEFSSHFEVLKAELIAQEYASSLHAGASRHFHFVLPDYREGAIQFGLLRKDLTPRPSYVALAAVGRFLHGAKCLGRYDVGNADAYVIAFHARPDGIEKDVVVAWTERPVDWPERSQAQCAFELPDGVNAESAFDYLGRRLEHGVPQVLTSAPVFLLFRPGELGKLPLTKPGSASVRSGVPSPVVLQLQWPDAEVASSVDGWTPVNDYVVSRGTDTVLQVQVYNFGTRAVRGNLEVVEKPTAWSVAIKNSDFAAGPMERGTCRLTLTAGSLASESGSNTWTKLRALVDGEPSAVLAFRVRER